MNESFVRSLAGDKFVEVLQSTGLNAQGGTLPEKDGVSLSYEVHAPQNPANNAPYVLVFTILKKPFYVTSQMIQTTLDTYLAQVVEQKEAYIGGNIQSIS